MFPTHHNSCPVSKSLNETAVRNETGQRSTQRLSQSPKTHECVEPSLRKVNRSVQHPLTLSSPVDGHAGRIDAIGALEPIPQGLKRALPNPVKINVSNPGKRLEFSHLFAQRQLALEATHHDIDEIDADPITVVIHKACQVPEGCLVEDTSLDVLGESVGVNIRWLEQDLPQYIGKPAVWRALLAIRDDSEVLVYQGEVSGMIVARRGSLGFGFDPYFLPDGGSKTLAQDKPDSVNARAKAVAAFCQQEVSVVRPAIFNWEGPWQKHHG